MKKENNLYSAFVDNNKNNSPPDKLLVWYYDRMLTPVNLFLWLVAFFTFFKEDYFEFLKKVYNNSITDNLFLSFLIIFSALGSMRIYQSMILAKKDYAKIAACFFDVLTYLFVVVFMSGVFIVKFSDNIKLLYFFYLIISVIGTINYFIFYFLRLDNYKNELDYLIGKRIQLFNFLMLFLMTVIFTIINIMLLNNIANIPIVFFGVIICLLLVLNIIHSGQLAAMPRIILKNDADSPDNVEESLKNSLGRVLKQESIKKIINISNKDIKKTFKNILISRVKKNDIEQIADSLAAEFGYVYEYIFETNDISKLKRVIKSLLNSAFGFGFFGYMNFYSIITYVNDKKVNVGWLKINTLHKCWIYSFIEIFSLPFVIIYQFGIKKFPEICRNAKQMINSQPDIEKNEFELSYFVIYEKYRYDNYGTYAMNLLVNALFHSKTSNIDCSKLILLVREFNTTALSLVRKAGFIEYDPEKKKTEPKEITELKGKGLYFYYE